MNLTYKLWTPAVVTGATASTVVSLNAASLTVLPQSSGVIVTGVYVGLNSALGSVSILDTAILPGEVTVALDVAALVSTAGLSASVPGAMAILLSVADLSAVAGGVICTVVIGETIVPLSVVPLSLLAQGGNVVPGGNLVILHTVELSASVSDVILIPGAVIVTVSAMDLLVLASSVSNLSGPVTYVIQSAEIIAVAPVAPVVPGSVAVSLSHALLGFYEYDLFNSDIPDGATIYLFNPRYLYSARNRAQFAFDSRKLNLMPRVRGVYFAVQRSIIKVRYSMATVIQTDGQSIAEVRTWYLDFSPDLPAGVTVVSAIAIHTPPYVTTAAVISVVVASPIVYVTLSDLEVIGIHYLDVRATLSDAQVSEMRLVIPVEF